MEEKLEIQTHIINKADTPQGAAEGGKADAYAYLPTSNAAIKATNDLLAQGVTLYRAEASFTDSGRDFGAGTFILPAEQANARSIANELANQYGLDVLALSGTPNGATLVQKQRIAVFADEGVEFVLKQFGFDYTRVSTSDLNAGILVSGGYDVFINSSRSYGPLQPTGKDALAAFIAGGGDYIGIGRTGVPFAVDAGLLAVTYEPGDSRHNGVVRLNYNAVDSVAAQYPEDSYAFVSGPVWFTDYAGLDVSAYVDEGDFFISGFWPGWDVDGAAGKPIILHGVKGAAQVTLMGINPTYRAHPEGTFRILANAIYNGLD